MFNVLQALAFEITKEQREKLESLDDKALKKLYTTPTWDEQFKRIFGAKVPNRQEMSSIRTTIGQIINQRKTTNSLRPAGVMTQVWAGKAEARIEEFKIDLPAPAVVSTTVATTTTTSALAITATAGTEAVTEAEKKPKKQQKLEKQKEEEKMSKPDYVSPSATAKLAAAAPAKVPKDIQRELVVTIGDEEIRTGRGPILQLTPVPQTMELLANFIASFTRETVSDGIVMFDKKEVFERYPGIDMAPLITIAGAMEGQRNEIYAIKESHTGLSHLYRILNLLKTMDKEQRAGLHTWVQINIFKTTKKGKNPTEAKSGQDLPSHVGEVKIGGKCYHIWSRPFQVKVTLNSVSKVKKESSLLPELSWISQASAAIGGSNIVDFTQTNDLCPGLSRVEAEVIRFVSVAMGCLSIHGKIVVNASETCLTLLYTSLRNYYATISPGKKPEDLIRSNVKVYTRGMKRALLQKVTSTYGPSVEGDNGELLVAFAPKAYTSLPTTEQVIAHNKEYYSDLCWERRVLFREVLVPDISFHYYMDGLPNLLTYWECTVPIAAMQYFEGAYSLISLQKVEATTLMSHARSAVTFRLQCPFNPPSVRSHRVMVVEGNKRLTVKFEDGDGLFELGNYVLEDYDEFADDSADANEEEKPKDDDKEEEKPKLLFKKKPKKKPAPKKQVKKKAKPPPEEEDEEEEEEEVPSEAEEEDEGEEIEY